MRKRSGGETGRKGLREREERGDTTEERRWSEGGR